LEKGLLDRVEIGEVGGGFEYFGIANNPLFVNDKCGTFGHAVHVEYEIIVEGSIRGGDGLVEVAQEGKVEVLVFFVPGEGENGIYADAENLGIGLAVESDVVAGAAKLFGAGTGECLREEKEEDILPGIVAERNFLFFGVEEGKIRRGLADLDAVGAHVKHLGREVSEF
jgi:hypothetical protein